ncbi:cyclophilin-like fold protein [Candidatus Auribacterota bacterium]
MEIVFETGSVSIKGRLMDSACAREIGNSLPIETAVNTWGDEIYFTIPEKCPSEKLTTDVSLGDIGFWPEGNCLCVFFGRTPMSVDDQPMPVSGIEIVGEITGDLSALKKINSGEKIAVKRA